MNVSHCTTLRYTPMCFKIENEIVNVQKGQKPDQRAVNSPWSLIGLLYDVIITFFANYMCLWVIKLIFVLIHSHSNRFICYVYLFICAKFCIGFVDIQEISWFT